MQCLCLGWRSDAHRAHRETVLKELLYRQSYDIPWVIIVWDDRLNCGPAASDDSYLR